jgi:hypothetical protein
VSSRCIARRCGSHFACSATIGRATGIATCISCLRQSPRARCLTLALAPNGAGPGCCSALRTSRSQPSRYPRARFHASPRAQPLVPSHAWGNSTLARGSGINNLPLSRKVLLNARRCAPRFNCSTRVSRVFSGVPPDSFRFVLSLPCALSPPRPHSAAAIRPDYMLIASALFGLRPMTDSPALHPLHATPRPLQMKQAPAAFVPPAANWQDSQEQLGRTRR